MTQVSGATSTETLAQDIETALNDPSIKGILLKIDSPGGAVTGLSEISDMMHSSRGKKPVWAYATGMCASAALWIASAADKIIASETATVGSVGVVAAYRDTKKADESAGVRTVEIVSSISPLKRVGIDTDEGRAKIQRGVDSVAGVFVQHLARNRGTDEVTVLSDFGQGDTFVGVRAYGEGLVDGIASFEDTLLSMVALCGTGSGGNKKLKKGASMSAENLEAGQVENTMTAEAVRESFPAAAEALAQQGKAEGMKAGAEAERARILALNSISVEGYEAIVESAIADGSSVEKTALALVQEQQKRGKAQADKIAADAAALAAQSAGLGTAPAAAQGNSEAAERKSAAENMAAAANKNRK
jgi:signal peptide peptidase SppA